MNPKRDAPERSGKPGRYFKTHSRPHVSDDNPYSESQFRTLEVARGVCQSFFQWYNHQHHHSGLGLMTPAMVHHGQAPHILTHRQAVLDAAYSAHPERFVRKPPRPPELPSQVWINKPPPGGKTP
jgi:putative transposase